MSTTRQQPAPDASYDSDEGLALYEQYGKPLETEHTGEYLAVSPDGKTILGEDLLEVFYQAAEQFGPGNYLFKIGEVAVGKWL